VSWLELAGYDTHPNEEKFLTIAFSITEREHGSHGICLPNALFMLTLSNFILTLREVQNADTAKRFMSLSRDRLTELSQVENDVRKAREQLKIIVLLSDMLAVRSDQLNERATITKLIHESERIHAENLPSLGEVC
jgi:hypothetical protein